MPQGVSRRFLEAQTARVAKIAGVTLALEGGPGWTVYRTDAGDGHGWSVVAYGRTKTACSDVLDGVEAGLRLAGRS